MVELSGVYQTGQSTRLAVSRENLRDVRSKTTLFRLSKIRKQGADEDTKCYYSKHNVLSVLGSHEFNKRVIDKFEETDLSQVRKALENKPQIMEIIKLICKHFNVTQKDICQNQPGKRQSNPVRAFAMFACRRYGDNSQKQIAEAFELSHPGSASFSINKVKKEISQGHWKKAIGWMEYQLGIVKLT